jgi:ribosome maturation factor RimP
VDVVSAFFCYGAPIEGIKRQARAEVNEGVERGRRVYRDIPEELRRLIEPVVDEYGCELVDVDSQIGSSRSGALRITVDRREGDGLVPVECCSEISREIGTQLDADDAARFGLPGPYSLEVSSPGLDRVLAREKDFAAACGKEVKIKTRRPVSGRRRFKGRLIDFSEGVAVLQVDGEQFEISFEDVEKANSMYQFTPADFAHDAKPGGRNR